MKFWLILSIIIATPAVAQDNGYVQIKKTNPNSKSMRGKIPANFVCLDYMGIKTQPNQAQSVLDKWTLVDDILYYTTEDRPGQRKFPYSGLTKVFIGGMIQKEDGSHLQRLSCTSN
jgi:hypothetical protein